MLLLGPWLQKLTGYLVILKMYTNVTNIIIRLSCGEECDKNAVLINAHFDTTLGSPGMFIEYSANTNESRKKLIIITMLKTNL